MNLISAPDGRYLRHGETIYRVIGQDSGTPNIVLEDEVGDRKFLPIEDFRMQIALGNVSEAKVPDFATRSLNHDTHEEKTFREAVLARVGRHRENGYGWPTAWEKARDELQSDAKHYERARSFPAIRTVQYWRQHAMRIGSRAMVDKRALSGNRNYRHDEVFEEIVFDLLESKFLTSDRMTVTQLSRHAAALYQAECAKRRLRPAPHGRKVVESIIASLPHEDVVKMRLDSKEARRRLNQAARFQQIKAPFERLEVDSTVADIFVIIDDQGNVARPHVTAAIDVATGLIVGLEIGIENPTAVTTAKVLKEAMTPASDAFFDRFEIENRLRTMGRPLTVVADQGSENSGDIIRRLIATAGFEFQQAIPGHPEKKPFIERFFGTFSGFVTQLPGATKTKMMPNRSRIAPAKAEAKLTLEDFTAFVQKWRFDSYAQTKRRRIHSIYRMSESPTEAWKRLEQEFLVPEPPSKRELRQIFFAKRVSRKLHHYGIEVDGIQYHSADLSYLSRILGTSEVEVWRDVTDIRTIGVTNPKSNELLFVGTKDPECPPLSVEELKRIRKALGKTSADRLTTEELLRSAAAGQHHSEKPLGTKHRRKLHEAKANRRNQRIREAAAKPHHSEESLVKRASQESKPIQRPAKLAKFSDEQVEK